MFGSIFRYKVKILVIMLDIICVLIRIFLVYLFILGIIMEIGCMKI